MTGPYRRLMKHLENQHGWGVSVVKYDEHGDLETGFVLCSLDTEIEMDEYVRGLAPILDLEVEDWRGELIPRERL